MASHHSKPFLSASKVGFVVSQQVLRYELLHFLEF